jgi:hypothetical protein
MSKTKSGVFKKATISYPHQDLKVAVRNHKDNEVEFSYTEESDISSNNFDVGSELSSSIDDFVNNH